MLLLSITIAQLAQSYYNLPATSGYSYVDPSGQTINVKFGHQHPYLPLIFQPRIGTYHQPVNANLIQPERKLFAPALQPYPAETRGQVEEYEKFLKEAAEEDAKERQQEASSTAKSYVAVKFGENSYNYQYWVTLFLKSST